MHRSQLLSATLVAALAACSNGANAPFSSSQLLPGAPTKLQHPAVTAPPGWSVRVFLRGDASRYNPDPIEAHGAFVYVAFQNKTGPKGGGGKSTIVQYRHGGRYVQEIQVPGRCDGMRWNPYTNLMWITVNEDANSSMFTWDPFSHALLHYKFSSASHGGGYDDLAFQNHHAFIAASNPTLNRNGKNRGPAVVSVVLKGTTAEVTPALMGNALATDIPTGHTVRLNLTDPDSMTVAPNGDVLLVSQADSEIVFMHNAGKASQSVSRLLVGTQLDDTIYATSRDGHFLLVDSVRNTVYNVAGPVLPGRLFTVVPSDSGVPSFFGRVDQATGTVTPIITRFKNPTGLIFVGDKG
jgi:hypothetical protein